MHSSEFLLQDTRGLELEIERHCAGLRLNYTDHYQVRNFTREVFQNMVQLKADANKGDRTARAKIELFGMSMMMHEANIKTFGPNYMTQIDGLAKGESAWVVFAKAMWSELESRKPNEDKT